MALSFPYYTVTWQFEMDKLNAAIAERVKVQGRTPRTMAQIVNHALYSVALKAQQYTPRAEVSKIDTSLKVTVNFVINKRGQRVPKKAPYTFSYGKGDYDFNSTETTNEELVFLIMLARANISRQGRDTGVSRYNELTMGRWALTKEQLKGGRAKIMAMADRLVKARHTSTSLLRAGWKPALDILRPRLSTSDIGGRFRLPETSSLLTGEKFAYTKDIGRLGTAIPARADWDQIWGRIENNVGSPGSGPLAAKQRAALIYYGREPLQRALADEEKSMMAYIQKYLDSDAAEFTKEMA